MVVICQLSIVQNSLLFYNFFQFICYFYLYDIYHFNIYYYLKVRLLGLHHLEVVALLKALPSDVVLVCCRIRAGKNDGGVDGTTYEVGRGIIDTSQHEKAFASRVNIFFSLIKISPLNLFKLTLIVLNSL